MSSEKKDTNYKLIVTALDGETIYTKETKYSYNPGKCIHKYRKA